MKALLGLEGRATRSLFLYAWTTIYIGIALGYYAVSVWGVPSEFMLYALLLAHACMLPITMKRLHDLSHSALWSPLILMSAVIAFMLFSDSVSGNPVILSGMKMLAWISFSMQAYLSLKKGHEGSNKYGDDPAWSGPRVKLDEFLSWADTSADK